MIDIGIILKSSAKKYIIDLNINKKKRLGKV